MSSIAHPHLRPCSADEILDDLSASAVGTVLTPACLATALAVVCRRRPVRHRKLPLQFMLLFSVLIHLYADEALPAVFAHLAGCWVS